MFQMKRRRLKNNQPLQTIVDEQSLTVKQFEIFTRWRSDKLKRQEETRDDVKPRGSQLRENLKTQRIKKMIDKFPTLSKTNSRVFKGIWAKISSGLDWEKVSRKGKKNPEKEINAPISKGTKCYNA